MTTLLVITGWHGEAWRCQAVTAKERRCTKDAVIEGLHPLRKVPMALCAQHAAIAQRDGTELRLNNAAGYAGQRLPVYGGTMDGAEGGVLVPYDLRPGDVWLMAIQNGQPEKYEMRRADDKPFGHTSAFYLQYIGPAIPSEPAAPSPGEPRSP